MQGGRYGGRADVPRVGGVCGGTVAGLRLQRLKENPAVLQFGARRTPVPISPFQVTRVSKILEAFCDDRVPPEVRDQVELRFRFEGNSVILFERRPAFQRPGDWTEIQIARFRYFVGRQEWALFWSDRNSKWQRYDLIPDSPSFEDLLTEVDSDPTCIFWG
jgi:hypothetical protein